MARRHKKDLVQKLKMRASGASGGPIRRPGSALSALHIGPLAGPLARILSFWTKSFLSQRTVAALHKDQWPAQDEVRLSSTTSSKPAVNSIGLLGRLSTDFGLSFFLSAQPWLLLHPTAHTDHQGDRPGGLPEERSSKHS